MGLSFQVEEESKFFRSCLDNSPIVRLEPFVQVFFVDDIIPSFVLSQASAWHFGHEMQHTIFFRVNTLDAARDPKSINQNVMRWKQKYLHV